MTASAEPQPPSALGRYRSCDEILAALGALEARGARRRVFGESVRGEPLVALEIGPEAAPRVSVLLAGMHAAEWIGVECGLGALERLASGPPLQRRVIAFPLLNVDGYRQVERDLRASRLRYRRGNGRGVDLNRNFPTFFRRAPRLARLLPFASPPGPYALSEPEVLGVTGYLEACERAGARVTHALSLHSFGQKVLYPYGGRWARPVEVARLRKVAEALCAQIGAPYAPVQCARWLPGSFAHGMELDHLHERFGATALLVECSRGGRSVLRPTSFLQPFAWYNPRDPRPVVADLAPALAWFLRGAEG